MEPRAQALESPAIRGPGAMEDEDAAWLGREIAHEDVVFKRDSEPLHRSTRSHLMRDCCRDAPHITLGIFPQAACRLPVSPCLCSAASFSPLALPLFLRYARCGETGGGFVPNESFNGKLIAHLLDREICYTLQGARIPNEQRRLERSIVRPIARSDPDRRLPGRSCGRLREALRGMPQGVF
jgi:hypothetical protein